MKKDYGKLAKQNFRTILNCLDQINHNQKMNEAARVHRQALKESQEKAKKSSLASSTTTYDPNKPYVFPVIEECMTYHTSWGKRDIKPEFEAISSVLNRFGLSCCFDNIKQGPTLTQHLLRPTGSTKYAQILKLKQEFCGALNNNGVRVYQDGAHVVVEVPGGSSTVRVADILRDDKFYNSNKLTVAIGKAIDGSNVLVDIDKMPHMLIAGTTGSGKSVFMQGLIVSLLLKHRPDQLEMYMVDPKMVEFSYYSKLGMCHVVTEPNDAIKLLSKLCSEMDLRYRQLAAAGVRDIDEYNVKMSVPMKRIVVFVDELADLIMTSKKDVENSIVRLAQKARACGIHLVLATQRPTANVVTGLIKSNIPTKVCFSVPSYHDSMVMLDRGGAESLLGKGDMLFKNGTGIDAIRLQGGFIESVEINNIVSVLMQNLK